MSELNQIRSSQPVQGIPQEQRERFKKKSKKKKARKKSSTADQTKGKVDEYI